MATFQSKYGADQVRERPAILLGSGGIQGARHCFYEIVGNSLDEFSSGRGDKLIISLFKDGALGVRDFGGGVPMDFDPTHVNEDGSKGAWQWDLAFNTLYSSGKYGMHQEELTQITDWNTFNPEDYDYLFSIGMNGVGATATQYASEYFEVHSYRNGKDSSMRFEAGKPVYPSLKITKSSEPRGTFIRFKPDDVVFSDTNITLSWLQSYCQGTAVVSGISIDLYDEASNTVTSYEGTNVIDHYTEEFGEQPQGFAYNEALHHEVLHGNRLVNGETISDLVVVCITKVALTPSGGSKYYNNHMPVRGGIHEDAFLNAQTDFFNFIFNKMGLTVKPEDYFNSISVFVHTLASFIDPEGQTKGMIHDQYIYKALYDNIYNTLVVSHSRGDAWIKGVVDAVEKRAIDRMNRTASAKEIKEVKKVIKTPDTPDKFISCVNYETKNFQDVEIFLAEGNSAATAIMLSRDGYNQAIYPCRGKVKNAYKSTALEALASPEIRDIVNILGCGISTGDDSTFDISKLRCSKIIFASDADVDGYHIRNLLFLIFYRFFPELLYNGLVYIAETPRYSIERSDGSKIYCRDEIELREYQSKGITGVVQRYKGLGEVDPEVLSETTINPATRNLTQVKIGPNDVEVFRALEMMYGSDTSMRKELVLDMINSDGAEGYFQLLRDAVQEEARHVKALGKEEVDVIKL